MSWFFRELAIVVIFTAGGTAFSLFSGLMPFPWEESEPAAGEIQLKNALALDVIWIDARSRADYDVEHIPEAILLNDSNWEAGIQNLMDVWLVELRPIVVYCSSEQCDSSKRIAALLREALPEAEIYSLKGGWEAWEK